MINNKKGFENSFAWIFAIIAGAVIIFLAIYAVANFINLFKDAKNSKTALEIGSLLTPFETSLEEGKINSIKTREETEIYNNCNENGDFGIQKISVQISTEIGKDNSRGEESSFKNKYLFSEKFIKGKEFYILSKPFDFPYKIGDLIIAWSSKKKYCFVDLRNYPEIKKDVESGSFGNVVNVTSAKNCLVGSVKVCFGGQSGECNITVEQNKVKYLNKNSEVYITNFGENNALLYAAIFSDADIFDCQLKRLLKRAIILEKLYEEKSKLPRSLGGCESFSYLGGDLISYKQEINSILNSNKPKINNAEMSVRGLDSKNVQNCELY